MLPTPSATSLAPSNPKARLRLNLLLGGGLLALMGFALLAPPSPPRRSAVKPSARELDSPVSTVAPAAVPGVNVADSGWEEVIPLRADAAAALAVHPEGELVCTVTGGDLEMRSLSGHFLVEGRSDGSFRLRPGRPTARGEAAAWCSGAMFTLRLRTEPAAPRLRRIWLAAPSATGASTPAAPPAGGAAPATGAAGGFPDRTTDPRLQQEAAALLEELLRAEAQGPGGDGMGEWGRGERGELAFAWRRALRRGELCGAVLDLTNRGAEPYFFEPTSLEVELPGRGVPPVLARSGEGMVLPSRTQPAIVIWHEPTPPGAPATAAPAAPPAGPYTLRLRPWPLPWRELVAVVSPPAAATARKARRPDSSARAAAGRPASSRSLIEEARHPKPFTP